MKIYLAARYGRRDELRSYAADLAVRGHEVTSRWLSGSHEHNDPNVPEGTSEQQLAWAREDFQDLWWSDICISFTEAVGSPYSRGGRHVEFGIALALELSCIIVGPRENIFHCLPTVDWYPDWPTALEALS